MKLTNHQQEVFERITHAIEENLFTFSSNRKPKDRLLSLTGQAGTGKSVLTTHIAKYIKTKIEKNNRYNNENVVVTAPTHKATKILNNMLFRDKVKVKCRTIHSFLGIEPIYNFTTGEEKFTVVRGRQAQKATASLLVIDESSMISHEMYKFIFDTITDGRVNSILFIGDPFQLLPVNSINNENDVFKLEKKFQLTNIVRQAKNNPIIQLATKIRMMIERQEFTNLKDL